MHGKSRIRILLHYHNLPPAAKKIRKKVLKKRRRKKTAPCSPQPSFLLLSFNLLPFPPLISFPSSKGRRRRRRGGHTPPVTFSSFLTAGVRADPSLLLSPFLQPILPSFSRNFTFKRRQRRRKNERERDDGRGFFLLSSRQRRMTSEKERFPEKEKGEKRERGTNERPFSGLHFWM